MFVVRKRKPVEFALYALKCPLDKSFKYIGLTIDPEIRLKQHISDSSYNKYKSEWIQNLKSQNLAPELVIIETFSDRIKASQKEIEFINLHKDTLLNGKKGIITYPVSPIGSSLEDKVDVTFTTNKEVLEKLKIIAKYDNRSREHEIGRLINCRYEEITSKGRTRKI